MTHLGGKMNSAEYQVWTWLSYLALIHSRLMCIWQWICFHSFFYPEHNGVHFMLWVQTLQVAYFKTDFFPAFLLPLLPFLNSLGNKTNIFPSQAKLCPPLPWRMSLPAKIKKLQTWELEQGLSQGHPMDTNFIYG